MVECALRNSKGESVPSELPQHDLSGADRRARAEKSRQILERLASSRIPRTVSATASPAPAPATSLPNLPMPSRCGELLPSYRSGITPSPPLVGNFRKNAPPLLNDFSFQFRSGLRNLWKRRKPFPGASGIDHHAVVENRFLSWISHRIQRRAPAAFHHFDIHGGIHSAA